MSQIKCEVRDCHYNHDRFCDASEIEVCCCGTTNVKCSDQTECRTFREKSGCHCE